MHSMFSKIVVWFSGMLLLSFLSLAAMSYVLVSGRSDDPVSRTLAMQADAASWVYTHGGPVELGAFLKRQAGYLPGAYYLTDARGRDLVSGDDRAAQVSQASTKPGLAAMGRPLTLMALTSDGQYRLVVLAQLPLDRAAPLLYVAWLPFAIGLLCYILAKHLASPLRTLRDTVDRFGLGDLSARSHSARRDEFGSLARAFDTMAERIECARAEERQLLLDISHELRSPLSRLGYAVELARLADDRGPALDRIYSRVDPHPGFKNVQLISRVWYGKGRLETEIRDVSSGLRTSTPHVVLSSSQLNALALSVFLALNLGVPHPPLDAVMLDDPIQSLDDVNLLGVMDLLRRYKANRQLLVSTHDQRFASLLQRKLRPSTSQESMVLVRLVDWTRSGPVLQQATIRTDESPWRIVRRAAQ